jgi:phosphatidate cytidylyltransferase
MNGAPGAGSRFADLTPRVASALALAVAGALAVWLGGWWFRVLVALAVAAMAWELSRMLEPAPPRVAALAGAVAIGLLPALGAGLSPASGVALMILPAAVLLLLPQLTGLRLGHGRSVAIYLGLVCIAGLGLIGLREGFGALWLLWLVLVVIASDVAGYFAGRMIGGPKLWPRVSPKKTWSGTVAGWLLALAVGAAFMPLLGQGAGFLALTLFVCVAGQAGDIAESALKRHVGVKDSSALIPGHGGAMDRFDAMMAAAVAFQLAALAGLVAQG